jgi:hypothetical protein
MGKTMKKDESEKAFVYFIDERHRTVCPDTPLGETSFSSYYSWFENKSPGHLKLRTSTTVREDCYRWFTDATGQRWRE